MKVNYHHKLLAIAVILLGAAVGKLQAQDSAVAPTILSLRYVLPQNKVPYIIVNTKKKVGRKFEPVKNVTVNVYFSEAVEANLLGKVSTAINGEGRIAFPPSFKNTWDTLNEFNFVAESVPGKGEEALSAELAVKKAMLTVDTLSEDGVRSVIASLKEKIGNEWVAVKDIEMKLGVKRSLGNLSVGDAETYTADSTGSAIAEFKRDSMPGDAKGNIILVAAVEENDVYGSLVIEKQVPWGKVAGQQNNFWHRSLWSTGDRAPVWLLLIALSIIIGVWGTIVYLLLQVLKVRRMGKAYEKHMAS